MFSKKYSILIFCIESAPTCLNIHKPVLKLPEYFIFTETSAFKRYLLGAKSWFATLFVFKEFTILLRSEWIDKCHTMFWTQWQRELRHTLQPKAMMRLWSQVWAGISDTEECQGPTVCFCTAILADLVTGFSWQDAEELRSQDDLQASALSWNPPTHVDKSKMASYPGGHSHQPANAQKQGCLVDQLLPTKWVSPAEPRLTCWPIERWAT